MLVCVCVFIYIFIYIYVYVGVYVSGSGLTIFMGCVSTMPYRVMRFWWLRECMAFTSLMKSSRPSESSRPAFRHLTATDCCRGPGEQGH